MFVGCLVVLCIKISLIPEPLELVSTHSIVYRPYCHCVI